MPFPPPQLGANTPVTPTYALFVDGTYEAVKPTPNRLPSTPPAREPIGPPTSPMIAPNVVVGALVVLFALTIVVRVGAGEHGSPGGSGDGGDIGAGVSVVVTIGAVTAVPPTPAPPLELVSVTKPPPRRPSHSRYNHVWRPTSIVGVWPTTVVHVFGSQGARALRPDASIKDVGLLKA
jgi:hypothetical protein